MKEIENNSYNGEETHEFDASRTIELKTNAELRNEAWQVLEGHWIKAIVATLIPFIIVFAIITFLGVSVAANTSSVVISILSLLIYCHLSYGFFILMLDMCRGNKVKIGTLFSSFNDYTRIVLTTFLMYIYTFLWSLLLIVPGIVKSYAYMMTLFVLRDRPELGYDKAINESMSMMKGHKMRLFLLHLSIYGWFILAIIVLDVILLIAPNAIPHSITSILLNIIYISIFFLIPFSCVATAAFYENLKTYCETHSELPRK